MDTTRREHSHLSKQNTNTNIIMYEVVYEDWSVILKTYDEVKKLWDTELSHNLPVMPVVRVINEPKKKSKGFS
tara:strand:+ start:23 stop:241 length:219 start_codon:yes stop_codon:yes gene_type:complete